MRWWGWVLLGLVLGGLTATGLAVQSAGTQRLAAQHVADSVTATWRAEATEAEADRERLRVKSDTLALALLQADHRVQVAEARLPALQGAIARLRGVLAAQTTSGDSLATTLRLIQAQTATLAAQDTAIAAAHMTIAAHLKMEAGLQAQLTVTLTQLHLVERRPPVVVTLVRNPDHVGIACVAGLGLTTRGVGWGSACGIVLKHLRIF